MEEGGWEEGKIEVGVGEGAEEKGEKYTTKEKQKGPGMGKENRRKSGPQWRDAYS